MAAASGEVLFVLTCIQLLIGCAEVEQSAPTPVVGELPAVTESEWHGYERLDFVVDGRPALLIIPDKPAPGNPWIWRAEWFGDAHAPQVQLALLARGWFVGYMNAQDMYGGPQSMALFDAYYNRVTTDYDLSPATVMEGFSRGGLYAINFAARHPDRVAVLYLDAPAIDIRSWPGRKHSGWQACLASYGIGDSDAEIDRINPVGRIGYLLAANIPVVAVTGDADRSVPYLENLAILEARYAAGGGTIQVTVKPGAGHSPHSLEDPTPIVDFILRHTEERPTDHD